MCGTNSEIALVILSSALVGGALTVLFREIVLLLKR